MKLISWNVNGIRACLQKGFIDYLKKEQPDVLCVQEIKAYIGDLTEEILHPAGYYSVWSPAKRRGYSGVAAFFKEKPINMGAGFGIEKYDIEGRVVWAEFENFILFNVYFPNGQKDDERLKYKLDFYKDFFSHVNKIKESGKNVIICGDYNTAHKEIDLANPKANESYSGFLPVERAWMDKIISFGYVDTFRHFNHESGQYSWWTYRFGARNRNIGWRIDYFFVNKEFLSKVKQAFIQKDILGSDHCPVGIEI